MKSGHRTAVAALVGALFWLAFWVKRPAQPEAPTLESLARVEGRVLQSAGPCTGGRSSSFVLHIHVAERLQRLAIRCSESFRAAAVGGSEVVLWLQNAPDHRGNAELTLWAAIVDGKQVLSYSESVSRLRNSRTYIWLFDVAIFLVGAFTAYVILIAVHVSNRRHAL